MKNATLDDANQFIKSLMKNKEKVINELFNGMEEMDKIFHGSGKVLDSIEDGSEANAKKQLKNNMIATMKVSRTMKQSLILLITMISFDDFSTNVAKMGMKTGAVDGQEYLREMLKQKMGNNFRF